MARIASVNLPNNKRLEAALPYLYGIGPTLAKKIIAATGVNPDARVKDMLDDDVNKVRRYIEENFKVEGDLRREVLTNIKRLKEIGSYRGSRHAKGLPVRGQRTKTNSRSVRGNKRATATSGKKPSAQKT